MNQYLQLDKQYHQQSQVLAKFARSLAKPKDDDSHTNLLFDAVSNALLTRWVELEDQILRLELQLNTGDFVLRDGNMQVAAKFDFLKIHLIEVSIQQWFDSQFTPKELFKPLHFDIPEYDGEVMEFVPDLTSRENWLLVRDLANWSCNYVAGHFQKDAEPRIWPHHFDTGIYFEATRKLGIGFGLAMADDMIDTPYFYCTPYGLNEHSIEWDSFDPLEKGSWFQSGDFRSAVLPVKDFSYNQLRSDLMEYVRSALIEFTKKAEG